MKGLPSTAYGGINLKGMPADTFSERVSLFVNTYSQCSVLPWYRTGSYPTDLALLNDTTENRLDPIWTATTANVNTSTPIYACSKI